MSSENFQHILSQFTMAIRTWNVHDSFRPTEVLFKLVGLLPLFWSDSHKYNHKHRFLNGVNFLANITKCLVISYLTQTLGRKKFEDSNFARSNVVTKMVVIATPLAYITLGFALAKQMKQIFQKLNQVDLEVVCGILVQFFLDFKFCYVSDELDVRWGPELSKTQADHHDRYCVAFEFVLHHD